MRTRLLALAAVVAVLLAVALPAAAKGVVGATVEGEGLDGPMRLSIEDHNFVALETASRVYDSVFGTAPVSADPPAGELGPRYLVSWRFPAYEGTDSVVQELYPLAEGGAVTYLAPGQTLYETEVTVGGWLSARAELAEALVTVTGVDLFPKSPTAKPAPAKAEVDKAPVKAVPEAPAVVKAAPVASPPASGGSSVEWPAVAATGAVAAAVAAGALMLWRRRAHHPLGT